MYDVEEIRGSRSLARHTDTSSLEPPFRRRRTVGTTRKGGDTACPTESMAGCSKL